METQTQSMWDTFYGLNVVDRWIFHIEKVMRMPKVRFYCASCQRIIRMQAKNVQQAIAIHEWNVHFRHRVESWSRRPKKRRGKNKRGRR